MKARQSLATRLSSLVSRLFSIFWRRRRTQRDFSEELQAHLALETDRLREEGLSEEDASAAARRNLGNITQAKERFYESHRWLWLDYLWQDLRFGLRQLRRNPGFTAVAIITLALGIGANTAIFSVVNGILLQPLPFPQADRLVMLWERNPAKGIDQERVSGPDFAEWRQQNRVFDSMAFWLGGVGATEFNLIGAQGTEKVGGIYASSALFSVLGVKPFMGRAFLPEEDHWQGNRVALISHGLWQSRFGADPHVLGRTLTVDSYGRRNYTIVGVMPAGFHFPNHCDLWLPAGWMGVHLDERRSAHWHSVIARAQARHDA